MTTRRSIEKRLRDLEAETEYADKDPGDLYMLMLKDASENAPDYPGAGDAYMRRLKREMLRDRLQELRRTDRFGVDDADDAAPDESESESAGGEP